MNAYQLKVSGETEIIAGGTVLEAIIFYCKETGFDISDFDKDDDIEIIPEDTWEGIFIKNTEYDSDDADDKDVFSLKELMAGVTEPEIISSTAY